MENRVQYAVNSTRVHSLQTRRTHCTLYNMTTGRSVIYDKTRRYNILHNTLHRRSIHVESLAIGSRNTSLFFHFFFFI